jgi:hypothetical protein
MGLEFIFLLVCIVLFDVVSVHLLTCLYCFLFFFILLCVLCPVLCVSPQFAPILGSEVPLFVLLCVFNSVL